MGEHGIGGLLRHLETPGTPRNSGDHGHNRGSKGVLEKRTGWGVPHRLDKPAEEDLALLETADLVFDQRSRGQGEGALGPEIEGTVVQAAGVIQVARGP